FRERVAIPAEQFLTDAAELFRTEPVRQAHLELGDDRDELRQLARCPFLERLEELDLGYGTLGNAGVRALAASPYLGNLRALGLSDCEIGPAGATGLADCRHLGQLRRLS